MSEVTGLVQIVEAALLAADKPLSVAHLGALFEDHERPGKDDIAAALAAASERCEDRGYELVEIASGFRFQVRGQLSPWVSRLWQERPQKYSRALLETLALIAYRQPITRGEIEEIRGVAVSTNIIRTLHEREWVRVVGHRDVPGRPAMYATTRQFLDYFNLKSLDQLPALAELRDLETLNAELGFSEPLGAGDEPAEQGSAAVAEDAREDSSQVPDGADSRSGASAQETAQVMVEAQATDAAEAETDAAQVDVDIADVDIAEVEAGEVEEPTPAGFEDMDSPDGEVIVS
ncbi:MAG: segregation and condensation protein B [Halieaceae bacterium]|jgi:segregation and condensation protein B